jgi:hypothetical protein
MHNIPHTKHDKVAEIQFLLRSREYLASKMAHSSFFNILICFYSVILIFVLFVSIIPFVRNVHVSALYTAKAVFSFCSPVDVGFGRDN